MTNAAIVARTRVLVVDGDDAARRVYESALRRAGYGDVVASGTIDGAWRSVNERRPDVTIVACRLPDGSGIQLLQRWRGIPRMEKVPALLLVSLELAETLQEATRAGANAILLEPCSGATLTKYLGHVVSRADSTATAARYSMAHQPPSTRADLPDDAPDDALLLHVHEGVFQARCGQCLRGSPPLSTTADEAARRAVALGWSQRSDAWECPVCIERNKTTTRRRQNRKVPEELILPGPVGARGFEPPTPRPPV